MKILFIHNYYQQPGGEDQVFSAESNMLKKHGHEVRLFTVHNDRIKGMNSLTVARNALWNTTIASDLREVIRKVRPDVIHFHNTFPFISPAAYCAAKAEGVPVVQTLHNYRFLCPNALFFRNGHICEDCMGKFALWPSVLHACYRKSRAATSVTAGMLSVHRVLRTYSRMVDIYIALTDLARQKFIQGGLPAEKIAVKPNFVDPDPGTGNGRGGYALFVGRLTQEKGVETLLQAWRNLAKVPLKLIGDGPLLDKAKSLSPKSVEVLGKKNHDKTLGYMANALFLVMPSEWYEGFPMTIAEAFACGVPVVASRLGAMAEIIEDGRTGLLFEAGNAEDLANKVQWLVEHPEKAEEMGRNARAEYEANYTPERNYEMLMEIYERAIACTY
jgi:glycosyltransferase involved in cell wall biosynthesis